MSNMNESTLMLCDLVKHCVNGIIVLDKQYHVLIWNQWMEDHSNIPADKILNQSLFNYIPQLAGGRLQQVIDNSLSKGMSAFLSQTLSKSPFPLKNPRSPFEEIKQSISIKPLNTDHKENYCYIHINDVSPAVKREHRLRELTANAQFEQKTAEEVADMKSNFVAMVSHELRTPMTSVLGSLGLVKGLLGNELPENVQSLINIAHTNTERLIALINDILDIEKITSGGVELNYETFDLMLFLNEAINANMGYAERQKVSFKLTEFPQTTLLRADFAKLQQVMNNLLSNAAKHEPEEGFIEISAQRFQEKVRISVKDHGPGIPEKFKNEIFDKFSQADNSNTRNIKGTGLGLAIAKAIIEKHEGEIGFISTLGEGAEFYIELPLNLST